MPGRELAGTMASLSRPGKKRSTKLRAPAPSLPMPTILEGDDHRPLRDIYSPAAARSEVISGVPANRGSFFSGQGASAPICLALYDVTDRSQPDQKEWGSRLLGDEDKVAPREDSLTIAGNAMAEALLFDDSNFSDGPAPEPSMSASPLKTPPHPQPAEPAMQRELLVSKPPLSDSDGEDGSDSDAEIKAYKRELRSRSKRRQRRQHRQQPQRPASLESGAQHIDVAGSYLAKAALQASSLRHAAEPHPSSEGQDSVEQPSLTRTSSAASFETAQSVAAGFEDCSSDADLGPCSPTKTPEAVAIVAEARAHEVIRAAQSLKAGKAMRQPMFDTAEDSCTSYSEARSHSTSPSPAESPNSVLPPAAGEARLANRRKSWPASSNRKLEITRPVATERKEEGSSSRQSSVAQVQPTVAQLAADLQRRHETLEQLISFYDSWVDKLGHKDLKIASVPDLSRISLEPSQSGLSLRTLSSTTPPYDCLASQEDASDAAEDSTLEVEVSEMSASSALSELSGSVQTLDSESSGIQGMGQVRTVVLSGGALYRGTTTVRDVPHGLGRFQLKRWEGDDVGDLYQGEFSNGLIHGLGVYFFGGCGWFSGEWQAGRQHGFGKQIFSNGTMYLGSFGKGGRLDGMGVCLYPSGDTYEGEFKEGLPHGQGYHKAADGGAYAGTFQEGRRSGLGQYRFSNGDQYAGEFQEDVPCGCGHYLTRFGEGMEGDFAAGKAHGWGVRTLPDGAMAAGKWDYSQLLWSRTIQRDSTFHELSDADMEGMDLAQETARAARHAAKLAQRAGKAARRCSAVSDAVRSAMAAAKQGDAASRRAAAVAQR